MEIILSDFTDYESGYKLFGSKTLFIFIYPYNKKIIWLESNFKEYYITI